jgi:ABC-type nitrate/sulfonate/bicarbonate transport system substrate-binding protein
MEPNRTVDEQGIELQAAARPAPSRREFLRPAGIGAGVLALGGAATTATLVLAQGHAFSLISSRPKMVLGWAATTCEVPLYLAYHKGFFAAEGLDVEMYAESATYDDLQGLSSGTLDGEQNPALYCFAPLEQGAAIRIRWTMVSPSVPWSSREASGGTRTWLRSWSLGPALLD